MISLLVDSVGSPNALRFRSGRIGVRGNLNSIPDRRQEYNCRELWRATIGAETQPHEELGRQLQELDASLQDVRYLLSDRYQSCPQSLSGICRRKWSNH